MKCINICYATKDGIGELSKIEYFMTICKFLIDYVADSADTCTSFLIDQCIE